MSVPSKTPLLDRVRHPADLRNLSVEQLKQLAAELRAETIDAVSVTGGHLGASLGVVELTVALHAVFDTPRDRLIWDVGHQAYPHKILTGPARSHSHRSPGRRPVRLHASCRERVRPVRRRAFLDLDLGRAGHGGGGRPEGRGPQDRRRDRRWRAQRRHGLRGHEQRRREPGRHDRGAERQRHVDRAARRRHERLPVAAHFLAAFPVPARADGQDGAPLPAPARAGGPARRRVRARPSDRRDLVRGAGFLLCRPDRRPRPRSPHAGAAQPPGHGSPGADAAACRDPEGQGLPARRAQRRQVPWRREVQCRHRRAIQGAGRAAVLHQGLRRGAGRRGRSRSTDRCRDGGDAFRHRPRSFRQAFPGPHLRCRHRRAARRHLRRRHGDRGHEAVLRDLFDVPPACLRPGRARRGAAEPAGALCPGSCRPGGRRRRHACRCLRHRLSRLPAQHGPDGRGR